MAVNNYHIPFRVIVDRNSQRVSIRNLSFTFPFILFPKLVSAYIYTYLISKRYTVITGRITSAYQLMVRLLKWVMVNINEKQYQCNTTMNKAHKEHGNSCLWETFCINSWYQSLKCTCAYFSVACTEWTRLGICIAGLEFKWFRWYNAGKNLDTISTRTLFTSATISHLRIEIIFRFAWWSNNAY